MQLTATDKSVRSSIRLIELCAEKLENTIGMNLCTNYYYLMHAKLPNRTVHLNESIKAHFIVRLCLSRPFLYQ